MRLMSAYGVSTLPELARAMEQGLSTVKNWSMRGSVPADALRTAAKDTGRSLDWLTFGDAINPPYEAETSTFQAAQPEKLKYPVEPEAIEVLERLKSLYQADSLSALAEQLGEPLATVKGWSQRQSVPLRVLLKAAAERDCSLDWLVGIAARNAAMHADRLAFHAEEPKAGTYAGSESISTPGPTPAAQGADASLHYEGQRDGAAAGAERDPVVLRLFGSVEYCFVPRYRPRPVIGRDAQNEEREAPGEIAFDAAWMRSTFGRIGDFCLVEVEGRNMEPTFHVGDLLLVDRIKRSVGAAGGLYAIRQGLEVSVRRLFSLHSGALQLISDNVAFPTETIERHQVAKLEIVGQVILQTTRRP